MDVRSDGTFDTEFSRSLQADRGQIVAHYLGGFAAAPADSKARPLER